MKDTCPDCAAKKGDNHVTGCDVERCAFCGHQAISCDCCIVQLGLPSDWDDELTDEEWAIWDAKCDLQGRMPWTGEWPGVAECKELGLWCYQDSSHYGNPRMHYGHIPCDKDHPKASVDLNRLYAEFKWDMGKKKFVKSVN